MFMVLKTTSLIAFDLLPGKHKKNEIIINIMNIVSGANLREEFEITALFHIPKKYPCSYAFAQMEQAKKELLIDDYSITQTSLEQVYANDRFLNFISFLLSFL